MLKTRSQPHEQGGDDALADRLGEALGVEHPLVVDVDVDEGPLVDVVADAVAGVVDHRHHQGNGQRQRDRDPGDTHDLDPVAAPHHLVAADLASGG